MLERPRLFVYFINGWKFGVVVASHLSKASHAQVLLPYDTVDKEWTALILGTLADWAASSLLIIVASTEAQRTP